MSLWKNNTYGVKGKKLLLVIGTVQFELLLHENFNCCDSIGFQVRGESRLFSSEDGPTLVSLKFCDIAAFHLWLSFKSLSFILTTILFIFLKYIDILFFLGFGCRYCSIQLKKKLLGVDSSGLSIISLNSTIFLVFETY